MRFNPPTNREVSSKKRVLIIGPDPERSLGGVATVINNTLNSQELAAEFDITMFSSFIDGGKLRRGIYMLWRGLRYQFMRLDYDVYHVHICSRTSTWRKMRYVKKLGINASKVILHVHGAQYHLFFEECNDSQRNRIRDFYASVGKVIVLSEEWRDWFITNNICDPAKIEILYNAVELPVINQTDYQSETVLFLGRMAERKSPDVLLRAATKVLPSHSEARFIFGGDGDVASYRTLSEELGIADRCVFLGWVSGKDKEKAFLDASIFCLPSKNEGMPMSVLEAMSYGLATIATPVGGIPQVIDDGVDGLIFPVDDIDTLIELLDKLLSSCDERCRLGEAGRQKIADKFSIDACFSRLSQIYKEVGW